MAKAPSERQLNYLKKLGYTGKPPASSAEASAAIAVLAAGGTLAEAEREMNKSGAFAAAKHRREVRDTLKHVKAEIADMVRENKDDPLYLGFLLVPFEDEPVSAEDAPYANAFVPLEVAKKHPQLLTRETLEYDAVMVGDKLPRGTLTVHGPGKVKKAKQRSSCGGCLLAVLLVLGVVVFALIYSEFGR